MSTVQPPVDNPHSDQWKYAQTQASHLQAWLNDHSLTHVSIISKCKLWEYVFPLVVDEWNDFVRSTEGGEYNTKARSDGDEEVEIYTPDVWMDGGPMGSLSTGKERPRVPWGSTNPWPWDNDMVRIAASTGSSGSSSGGGGTRGPTSTTPTPRMSATKKICLFYKTCLKASLATGVTKVRRQLAT